MSDHKKLSALQQELLRLLRREEEKHNYWVSVPKKFPARTVLSLRSRRLIQARKTREGYKARAASCCPCPTCVAHPPVIAGAGK